jgi:hypothetical protein
VTVTKFHELIDAANTTRQIAARKFYVLLGIILSVNISIISSINASYSELLTHQKIKVRQTEPYGEILTKVLPPVQQTSD